MLLDQRLAVLESNVARLVDKISAKDSAARTTVEKAF
jgi:uncharacterized small protein (DUF1192 family)